MVRRLVVSLQVDDAALVLLKHGSHRTIRARPLPRVLLHVRQGMNVQMSRLDTVERKPIGIWELSRRHGGHFAEPPW